MFLALIGPKQLSGQSSRPKLTNFWGDLRPEFVLATAVSPAELVALDVQVQRVRHTDEGVNDDTAIGSVKI